MPRLEPADGSGEDSARPGPAKGLGAGLVDRFAAERARMSAVEAQIVDGRLYRDDPVTLAEIAARFGLSGEWIRRLHIGLKASIEAAAAEQIGLMACAIGESVGPVTTCAELERQVLSALEIDGAHPPTADPEPSSRSPRRPSHLEIDGAHPPTADPEPHESAAGLARRMLLARLGYSCRDGVCLNREAGRVARRLRRAAAVVADDVGLVDEADLLPCLPGPEWAEHFPTLVAWSGLRRVVGRIALRDSNRARAKAALIHIGKPATKEEIAEVAGMPPASAAASFTNTASVVRADRRRWGLSEWIDCAYEGIATAMARQIEQDGGESPFSKLAAEIPRRFGVSASSVRTFAACPRFVCSNGRVRLRRPDEPFAINRPEVRQWPGTFALGSRRVGVCFVVDDDIFRGSGRQLPAAAAAIIGLNVNETMRFDGPAQTTVAVRWPDTSATGPSFGSTRMLATAVGAEEDDVLTVVLDANNATVAATATDPARHAPGWPLVARLTGIDERDGLEGLARALGCPPSEALAVLEHRGDTLILEALPESAHPLPPATPGPL